MIFTDIKLGDCLSMIENGVTIKQKEGASGYPITRIETLSNDRFNRDRLGYADIENIEAYTDHILDNEDLIMSHINSRPFLGRTVIYLKRGDEKIIHGMNVLRIKTNRELLNPFYAYYYFKTPHFRKAIDNIRTDAINQSSINTNNIKDITIHIPSITSQNSIVNVLRGIDKKIEINEEVNAELEAMAKQLYDYWFVQFDFPDENGKPYKSSGGKMVYNEILKREIPEGWGVQKLEEILSLLRDGTHNPPKRVESGIPLLTGTMFGNYFIDHSLATYITEVDYNNIHKQYKPQSGDIILTKIGTIGNVNFLRDKDIPLAIHCNSALLRLKAMKGQSVQELVSLEKIGSVRVEIPNNEIISLFNQKVDKIFDEIKNLTEEIDSLSHLRDSLLPMLMNGQVTVE